MTTTEKRSGSIPPAEPQRFADLVDFQDGSIVSRTVAASKAGTLTLFAFDEGQSLSEHSAPYDAYVTVLEGVGELVIDGKSVTTKAGETVLMPGNIPHSVHADERFKMLLIMIRG
ncbi:MAG: cupin domain-containing protein [Deltaproteobacteria bacterium]|nr:cupin domain-containing protein [Deltaproteobacteria bacterium]